MRAARRSDALAKARFYRTLIAFQAADKTGFDQGLWDRVIELGERFFQQGFSIFIFGNIGEP